MNPNPSHDRLPDEVEAANLTAHALGQLEGDERAAMAARLARPDADEERRILDETRRIASTLERDRAESLASTENPGRSQDLRRRVIATLAAAPSAAIESHGRASATPASARRRPWGLLAIVGSLAAAILVSATAWLNVQGVAHKAVREVAKADHRGEPAGPAKAPQPTDKGRKGSVPPPVPTRRAEAGKAQPGMEGGINANAIAELDSSEPKLVLVDEFSASPARAAAAPPAKRSLAAPRSRSIEGERSARRLDSRAAQEQNAAAQERAQDFSGEGYERLEENRSRTVADDPLSTFSIDVDTASYANVRRFLSAGRLPPKDAVRIEELVNYFRYDDPEPRGDEPFSVVVESAASPWHDGRLLVRIGLRGRDIDRSRRPAGNIVFLIDVSGSMQSPDKLPLVKQAIAMLVEELTENDRVSIVTYAGDAGLVLPPTTGDQKGRILAAIEGLVAGGSTHGSAGLELAYDQAAEHFIEKGVNRVILATDGDLNVGVTSDAALVELIKRKAAGGTFLTVLGFGQGNLQDAKMEKLADNGNGVYAYIDGTREARKVLVEQLTGSTITIAKDVKIQVEFNPATVASYRLIGYENRVLANQDFRDDRKDAGEIGAGHAVTALYEIVPAGGAAGDGPGRGAEPLKYQRNPEPAAAAKPAAIDGPAGRELLTVKLRFKEPDGQTSVLREVPLADRGGSFEAASADLRFAAAVAAFGMILRESEQAGAATLDSAAAIAGRAIGRDEGGYRAEFLDLVRKAAALDRGHGPSPRE